MEVIIRNLNSEVSIFGLLPPHLISPNSDSLNLPVYLFFKMEQRKNAESYSLQLFSANDTSAIINQNGIVDTLFGLSNLQNEMEYYWRVKSVNVLDTSDWSEASNFKTIVASPIAPSLSTPPDNSGGFSSQLIFSWNRASSADYYNLIVATDSLFQNKIFNDSSIVDTAKDVF